MPLRSKKAPNSITSPAPSLMLHEEDLLRVQEEILGFPVKISSAGNERLISPDSSGRRRPCLHSREAHRRCASECERERMYQWQKFEFFEEKSVGKATIPDEIAGGINCCSGGRGSIVVGCDDGTVGFLDRGFKLLYGFQAHDASVLFLQHLKARRNSLKYIS